VFDWDKAARLIAEQKPKRASAGLRDDWGATADTIYRDGEPVMDASPYLASNWAIPELAMDGCYQECWRWQTDTPGWDSGTLWPESALAILHATPPEP
jgi:hypothetical protein